MKIYFVRRLIAALFAAILFPIVSAIVFMNESYGFGFYGIAFLIFGAPAILLVGLPFSIGLDWLLGLVRLKSKIVKVSLHLLLYAAGGMVGTVLYFFAIGMVQSLSLILREPGPLILGILAAWMFLIMKVLVYLIADRLKVRTEHEED